MASLTALSMAASVSVVRASVRKVLVPLYWDMFGLPEKFV